MDKKTEHLKLIQNIITRMGGNLFLLKGWAVTLIVALFAIAAKDVEGIYVLFSFFILIIFWILDGFFLSIERCFKELYNDVRLKKEEEIDFSMKYNNHNKGRNTWTKSIFSKTLLIFYGTLLVFMLILSIIFKVDKIKFNFNVDWKNEQSQSLSLNATTTKSINK